MQDIEKTISELDTFNIRFHADTPYFIYLLDFLCIKSGVEATAKYLSTDCDTIQNWRQRKSEPSFSEALRILRRLGYILQFERRGIR